MGTSNKGKLKDMAEPAPATENNEARRIEMLRAAAELICERTSVSVEHLAAPLF